MDWILGIEIFAAVTGAIYVVLEILQKNAMWLVGILTASACAFSFGVQHVWASMGLNIYYVVVSVIGFIRWREDSAQVGESEIHLNHLDKRTVLWSGLVFVIGWLLMSRLLGVTADVAPLLDAAATVLSIIATWWLAQSYLPQWLLWIVADIFTTSLCLYTGQYWMAGLYLMYIASAVYGFIHWKKQGKFVN